MIILMNSTIQTEELNLTLFMNVRVKCTVLNTLYLHLKALNIMYQFCSTLQFLSQKSQ